MSDYFRPENSALLLIDHQVGTMQLIKNIPLEVVKRNTLALAKTAKIFGMPVGLTSSQEERLQAHSSLNWRKSYRMLLKCG